MPAPRRRGREHPPLPPHFEAIHLNAAGIDIGAIEHWVAVPTDRDAHPVRSFPAFTADLERLADWLEQCDIDTVVMESTGKYWTTLFDLLEARGFEVLLVDPRRLKHVPGRKSDIRDCQHLQQLHTFGLLAAAFRPAEQVVCLRTYVRQRSKLVAQATSHIHAMQNALTLMNLKLQHVVSEVHGVTGLTIMRAILAGQRDPGELAKFRDPRCKSDEATIAASLRGNWRDDHLFVLRQSVDAYDHCQRLISECTEAIVAALASFDSVADPADLPPAKPSRKRNSKPSQSNLRAELFRITGVDLFAIKGLDERTLVTILSETGTDMTRWPTVKHFTSWLGLCPAHDISGGKVLRRGTRPNAGRANLAFRLAAQSLHHSQSALGAFYRRKRAQRGAPKAITATAHKLARAFYNALRFGIQYVDLGAQYYEQRYREQQLKRVKREAARLGLDVVPKASPPEALPIPIPT